MLIFGYENNLLKDIALTSLSIFFSALTISVIYNLITLSEIDKSRRIKVSIYFSIFFFIFDLITAQWKLGILEIFFNFLVLVISSLLEAITIYLGLLFGNKLVSNFEGKKRKRNVR
jgi:hypothetical protein